MFAAKDDYRAYRAVRLAPKGEQRLLAMRRYLSAHPDGQWSARLARERKAQDQPTFERGKSTRAGLDFYLEAFPDGAFAEQARARLTAVTAIEKRKAQEQQQALAREQARKQHEAELRRTWVTRFVGYWAQTLMALQNWGAPIADVARVNGAFSNAFGQAPRPRCTEDECVKYYQSDYAIPVPGSTRMERRMQLILRLRMAGGRLTAAELLLPRWGFSRWFELEHRRLVVDSDPKERTEAIEWALGIVAPALGVEQAVWKPEPDYVLPDLPKPAIASSGELLDTTVADPSAPANRTQSQMQPAAGAAGGSPEPPPAAAALVAPEQPEAAPDMVMAPMRVGLDDQGGARPGDLSMEPGQAPARDQVAAPGEDVMVMDAMTVPGEGTSPGNAPVAAATELVHSPPVTRAYRAGRFRAVVFAAGSAAGEPAYDGGRIELVK